MTQREAWRLQIAADIAAGFVASHTEHLHFTKKRDYVRESLQWADALMEESGVNFDD